MPKVDFLIGADPEMVITNNNTVINGVTIVPSRNASFGVDGNSITMEIRPDPATNPIALVNNIRQIFVHKLMTDKRFAEYDWHAGSGFKQINGSFLPTGGHIHFGLSSSAVDCSAATNILDNYLAPLSILIESPSQARGRRVSGYGTVGDYRSQSWGFEYRVISSWLTSPYIAAAILSLAKALVYEKVNNPEFVFGVSGARGFVNTVDIANLRNFVAPIWSDITKLTLYKTYKEYIDIIKFLIDNRLTWFPSVSLKEAWGVSPVSEISNGKITMSQIW